MDRIQPFVRDHLLSRSFDDPDRLFRDKRVQETLLLLPTDGGLASRLKKRKSGTSLLHRQANQVPKHANYRKINQNSKKALSEYINSSRKATSDAEKIANERNLHSKETVNEYLKEHHAYVYNKLPHYSIFSQMYQELWVNYMRETLGIPARMTSASQLSINGANSLLKLSMADYNGAKLNVTKSSNPNLVGIEGIVVWDAQQSFILITEGTLVDKIKCIPKKGTVFTFEVPINEDEALQYSILGDRFKYRSSDRAGRKFKSRRCDDLLYYLQL
ncbi:LAMI_0H11122g1_1 [Lachancea mirantina]|uniref:Ribonuclease P protein subunit n=1 Tax=Lachancea mirantina TaxID=1230905 RepID=A0A1G4KH04_9SACH|nr:LAMI_0H11122g1_1 [Lachancea mirantina]